MLEKGLGLGVLGLGEVGEGLAELVDDIFAVLFQHTLNIFRTRNFRHQQQNPDPRNLPNFRSWIVQILHGKQDNFDNKERVRNRLFSMFL